MTSAKKEKHKPLVCKICMKRQGKLSVHLRRVCKKTASKAEITHAVEEAKKRHRLVESLGVVSYEDLDYHKSGFSDPQKFFEDFLERHGCIIIDKPFKSFRPPSVEKDKSKDKVGVAARPPSVEKDKSKDQVGVATVMSPTLPRRKRLAQKGVHKNLNSSVLDSFKQYLKSNFSCSRIKKIVESVNRYLHFVIPDEASLEFLNNLELTKKYFRTYLDLKTYRYTVKKHINNVQEFVKFIASEEFPNDITEDTRQAAETFIAVLREINKEANQTFTKVQNSRSLTPKDCRKVLMVTKPYVLDIFAKANLGSELDHREKILACYYLQSLLSLVHLCKPGVLQNLMVKDWLKRKYHMCVDGKFTEKVAIIRTGHRIIVLQEDEELLFNIYLQRIRPTLLVKDAKTVDQFFVSSNGQSIKNASNVLMRYLQKFQQPLVRWKEAKDAFKDWAFENLSEEDRHVVNCYIGFGDLKEEVSKDKLVSAMFILTKLKAVNQGGSSSSPAGKKRKWTEVKEEEVEESDEEDGEEEVINSEGIVNFKVDYFKRLLERHPVGLIQTPPSIKLCRQVSQSHAQYCADKWLRTQYKIRIRHVIAHFRNVPRKNQILKYMKQQGWTVNLPRTCDVLRAWKPQESKKLYKKHG
ncbi:uncharacterized protein LOC142731240 [Rhinoderma darwinii]|uniref:uncharacterized protein LOC142731240 n=1 Tax=Rhinoderma darwinii TaxID=43563 RepID=UPI003F67145D